MYFLIYTAISQAGSFGNATSYLINSHARSIGRLAILVVSSPQPLHRIQPPLQEDVRRLVVSLLLRLIRYLSHSGESLVHTTRLLTYEIYLGLLQKVIDAGVRQIRRVGHAADCRDFGLSARDQRITRHLYAAQLAVSQRINVNRLIYLGPRRSSPWRFGWRLGYRSATSQGRARCYRSPSPSRHRKPLATCNKQTNSRPTCANSHSGRSLHGAILQSNFGSRCTQEL